MRPEDGFVAMEHWVEVNLECKLKDQDRILLDVLWPHVAELEKREKLVTWHYFREPEIRFRVRMKTSVARAKETREIRRIASSLTKKRTVSEWHFGNHGEEGRSYFGEEDRYGKEGWRVAQEYFRRGSETALALLQLKRSGKLENPLWGKGLGNPWEGGKDNPWRRRDDDPLAFHWSRFVHLFSNQLGYDMEKEADMAARQAENYRRVRREFGMNW